MENYAKRLIKVARGHLFLEIRFIHQRYSNLDHVGFDYPIVRK